MSAVDALALICPYVGAMLSLADRCSMRLAHSCFSQCCTMVVEREVVWKMTQTSVYNLRKKIDTLLMIHPRKFDLFITVDPSLTTNGWIRLLKFTLSFPCTVGIFTPVALERFSDCISEVYSTESVINRIPFEIVRIWNIFDVDVIKRFFGILVAAKMNTDRVFHMLNLVSFDGNDAISSVKLLSAVVDGVLSFPTAEESPIKLGDLIEAIHFTQNYESDTITPQVIDHLVTVPCIDVLLNMLLCGSDDLENTFLPSISATHLRIQSPSTVHNLHWTKHCKEVYNRLECIELRDFHISSTLDSPVKLNIFYEWLPRRVIFSAKSLTDPTVLIVLEKLLTNMNVGSCTECVLRQQYNTDVYMDEALCTLILSHVLSAIKGRPRNHVKLKIYVIRKKSYESARSYVTDAILPSASDYMNALKQLEGNGWLFDTWSKLKVPQLNP